MATSLALDKGNLRYQVAVENAGRFMPEQMKKWQIKLSLE